MPTLAEIENARRTFVQREPRHLFYKVATELVDLSLKGATRISLAEALAVLLQTWNKAHYQYRGFDEQHFKDIEQLISSNQAAVTKFRSREISSFAKMDEDVVRVLFNRFAQVLGPVGAAKCLHLLAPMFFPLWDRAIAKAYRINLDNCAFDEYVAFMGVVRQRCALLREAGAPWPDMLKAIDEFNYCTFTLKAGADSG